MKFSCSQTPEVCYISSQSLQPVPGNGHSTGMGKAPSCSTSGRQGLQGKGEQPKENALMNPMLVHDYCTASLYLIFD